MIEGKNFMGVPIEDIPKDTEYRHCNFSQPQCIDVAGQKKGVRLFPGDDTPITFIGCNLVNCEPPPGSLIMGKSNSTIKEFQAKDSTELITIDGFDIDVDSYVDIIYGRYRDGAYEYLSTPTKVPVKIKNVEVL